MKIPTGSPSCTRSALSSAVFHATFLFPPRQKKAFHEAILKELLQERVSSSRGRVNPRGVKRKMSNYPLRSRKRQRTRRFDFGQRLRIVK
jgi:hypothetical protein